MLNWLKLKIMKIFVINVINNNLNYNFAILIIIIIKCVNFALLKITKHLLNKQLKIELIN